jgi:hypothetical protein
MKYRPPAFSLTIHGFPADISQSSVSIGGNATILPATPARASVFSASAAGNGSIRSAVMRSR